MILRVSAKVQRQYSCPVDARDVPVAPFPQTWNLDMLSHGRGQLIVLASEEYSLFSVLIPMNRSRSFELFEKAFRRRLSKLFENLHWWNHPATNDPLKICRRSDRQIIGSQNDFLFQTFSYLQYCQQPASDKELLGIEKKVNESPMSYLGMGSPIDMFLQRRRRMEASQ